MYSPVLAALLTPNVLLGEWWGKALFAACDCAVGVMIMRLLQRHALALPLACTWLLNPIVVNVSTRGNAEGFVAVWAVASLYAFERRRYTAAAVLLGIAAHIKIYPVVYGVPMALFLLRAQQSPDFAPKDFMQRVRSAAAFGAGMCSRFVARSLTAHDPRTVAAATFIAITSLCYAVYGYAFLFEVVERLSVPCALHSC
jgi:phosphatidylinositol glycan class M